MMGHRSKLSGGWEWDLLTRARKYFNKAPGVAAYTKRRHNKRLRKQTKQDIRNETRSTGR